MKNKHAVVMRPFDMSCIVCQHSITVWWNSFFLNSREFFIFCFEYLDYGLDDVVVHLPTYRLEYSLLLMENILMLVSWCITAVLGPSPTVHTNTHTEKLLLSVFINCRFSLCRHSMHTASCAPCKLLPALHANHFPLHAHHFLCCTHSMQTTSCSVLPALSFQRRWRTG